MFNKRINIFIGHFGSGKTEVALNYALQMSKSGKKTRIVDCDIVNTYFRTVDAKEFLKENNIQVINSIYANTNVDVPALPAEINSIFLNKNESIVFDVGGDDLGARVVSRYKEDFQSENYELFMVINTKRPMTDSVQKIEKMIDDLESSARMKITKLINNTNLLDETTIEHIMDGQKIIEEVSKKRGIELAFISGLRDILNERTQELSSETLLITKLIKVPWQH